MRPLGKALAAATAATLVLGFLTAPLISGALAAYSPTQGWTRQAAPSIGNQRAITDATVIKDGSTYRMWYTRVHLNESFASIMGHTANLGVADIVDAVLEFRQADLLDALANLNGTDLANLLGSFTSVIGYATSLDGQTWTIPNNQALSQGTTALDAIGAPVVIKDGATYRMWYTRLETDYSAAGLNAILDGLDDPLLVNRQQAIVDLISQTRTVIAYAESSDGANWTVQDPQVLPSAGGGDIFSSVGAPSIVKNDDGSHEMWYTRAKTDLTPPAQWAAILTDTDNYDIDALAGLLDGTAAVIGYATSPDGVAWTVQNADALPGNTAL